VDLTFKKKNLQKLANDYKACQKEFGAIRAKLYLKRLSDLKDVLTLEDVRNLPGKYHELSGNRKGQWSCDLDQPENPIPSSPDGKYLWIEIKGVEIIEIVDYH